MRFILCELKASPILDKVQDDNLIVLKSQQCNVLCLLCNLRNNFQLISLAMFWNGKDRWGVNLILYYIYKLSIPNKLTVGMGGGGRPQKTNETLNIPNITNIVNRNYFLYILHYNSFLFEHVKRSKSNLSLFMHWSFTKYTIGISYRKKSCGAMGGGRSITIRR